MTKAELRRDYNTVLGHSFLGGEYLPRMWREDTPSSDPGFYLLSFCEREAEFLIMVTGALSSEVL